MANAIIKKRIKNKIQPIIEDGLVLHLDGRDFSNNPASAVWKDRSKEGNDATANGFAYSNSSGSDGNLGVTLDGVDDSFNCGNDESLILGSSGSIETFITINSWMSHYDQIIWKRGASWKDIDYGLLRIGTDHQIIGTISNGSSYLATNGPKTSLLTLGIKYHLVFTWNGSKAKMYTNGVLTGIVSTSIVPLNTSANVLISTHYNLNASIYSIKLYNKALSSSEIKSNYVNSMMPFAIKNNKVPNWNFGNGIDNWFGVGSNLNINNNIISVVGNGTTKWISPRITTNIIAKNGDVIFTYTKVIPMNNTTTMYSILNAGISQSSGTYISNLNEELEVYKKKTLAGQTEDHYVNYYIQFAQTDVNTLEVGTVDGNAGVFAINMTELGIENYTEDQMLDLVHKAQDWYKGEIVKDGLVLHLDGKDFTNSPNCLAWRDRSGNKNDLIPSGFAYTSSSGNDGNGVRFDGINDKCVAKNSELYSIIGDLTVEITFTPNLNVRNFHPLIYKDYSYEWFLGIDNRSTGMTSIAWRQGAGSAEYHTFSNVLTEGNIEYTISIVRRKANKTLEIYKNGVKFNECLYNVEPTKSNNNLAMGIWTSYEYSGSTRIARVYNRALTESEIKQNYLATKGD